MTFSMSLDGHQKGDLKFPTRLWVYLSVMILGIILSGFTQRISRAVKEQLLSFTNSSVFFIFERALAAPVKLLQKVAFVS